MNCRRPSLPGPWPSDLSFLRAKYTKLDVDDDFIKFYTINYFFYYHLVNNHMGYKMHKYWNPHKKARNSDPIRTNATKLPSVKVKQPREQHTDAFVTRYLHNPQECLRVDFGRDPAEFPSSAGFRPFSSNTHFQVQLNFHPIWLKNCKKGNKMKGFSGLVASFLAVSTFPLLSFPSQFQVILLLISF